MADLKRYQKEPVWEKELEKISKSNELKFPDLDSLMPHQKEVIFSPVRFKTLVWHRRARKTSTAIVETIRQALIRPGVYWHIFPTYGEAKDAVWRDPNMLFRIIPESVIKKTNESELVVTLQTDKGKSIFQLKGADDPDALRGPNPYGIIFDEWEKMKYEAWGITEPILRANGGWAWFIGCVTKDTLILGEQGLEEIGTSPLSYSPEQKRLYGLGGFHLADQRFGNPTLPTKKLLTKAGLELEATPNHKVWTPLGWKQLDQLKTKDPLYLQYSQKIFGGESCNPDFAYFLGLYLAEGNCERKIYRITISSGDEEIHRWLSKTFGFTRQDKFHSRKNSKKFMEELMGWFPDIGTVHAKEKTLSKKVLKMREAELRNFLSGYFDGDGSCHKNKQTVTCVSSSYILSKQLQCLLLNMGYRTHRVTVHTLPTVRVSKTSIGYRLEIEGNSAYRFSREIGFHLLRKQKNTGNWKEGNGHLVWFNRKDFGELTSREGYLGRCKKVTQKTLKRLDKNLTYDERLLADEVVSVTDSFAETFDFCIPETHSYFTNGLVSHNTPMGRNHLWDFYQKGLKGHGEWKSWLLKASTSGIIPQHELAESRLSMSEALYNQEWECEFLEGVGQVFRGVRDICTSVPSKPLEGHYYTIGCDLAKVTDYTVISVFDNSTNCQVYQQKIQHLEWPFQKKIIAEVARMYNNALVVLDATGLGDPIADDLLRAGVSVEPIKISEPVKKEMVEKLSIYIEQKHIRILNMEDTLLEFDNYSYSLGPTGRVKYGAPSGYHDDVVTSIALAVYRLNPVLSYKVEKPRNLIQQHYDQAKKSYDNTDADGWREWEQDV